MNRQANLARCYADVPPSRRSLLRVSHAHCGIDESANETLGQVVTLSIMGNLTKTYFF